MTFSFCIIHISAFTINMRATFVGLVSGSLDPTLAAWTCPPASGWLWDPPVPTVMVWLWSPAESTVKLWVCDAEVLTETECVWSPLLLIVIECECVPALPVFAAVVKVPPMSRSLLPPVAPFALSSFCRSEKLCLWPPASPELAVWPCPPAVPVLAVWLCCPPLFVVPKQVAKTKVIEFFFVHFWSDSLAKVWFTVTADEWPWE